MEGGYRFDVCVRKDEEIPRRLVGRIVNGGPSAEPYCMPFGHNAQVSGM